MFKNTFALLLIALLTSLSFQALSEEEAPAINQGNPAKFKQFEAPEQSVPKYFSMDKVVVNFRGEGKAKFLAVDLKFMSYMPQVVEVEMEYLRPILKNDIDRLLRNQTYSKLKTPDGPDQLRAEILEVSRKILEEHRIYPDLLEDVFLGRFVMQ
ncbi:MAG: flagellar basal body-associated FliL family protein [Thiomicrorhabdus sp.]|nr:flagellar basal body-associated FliL family protein [Thiomicrorhabdus sp.]